MYTDSQKDFNQILDWSFGIISAMKGYLCIQKAAAKQVNE
jgi:hypothetical protein